MRDLSTEKGLVKNVRVQVVSRVMHVVRPLRRNQFQFTYTGEDISILAPSHHILIPTSTFQLDGAALTIPSPIGLWNSCQGLTLHRVPR
jgi:hypothetical protein